MVVASGFLGNVLGMGVTINEMFAAVKQNVYLCFFWVGALFIGS